jgi:hypothetical protein
VRLELAGALEAVDRGRDDGALEARLLGDLGRRDAGALEDLREDQLLVGALRRAPVAAGLRAAPPPADQRLDGGHRRGGCGCRRRRLREQRVEVRQLARGGLLAVEQRQDPAQLLELGDHRLQLADAGFDGLTDLVDGGAHWWRRQLLTTRKLQYEA